MIVVMPAIQLQASIASRRGSSPIRQAAARGASVYVSLGCVYCHSQQPRDPSSAPDASARLGPPVRARRLRLRLAAPARHHAHGPDLLNIGARQPSADWHLTHLYNPRAVMPLQHHASYPFLFEIRPQPLDGDVVVKLPPGHAPESGVVVARRDALDLVQYLLELDRTYPVEEIPVIDAAEEG
jgi:cytochrome c oxidase cbb3-type subunit 2